MPELASSIKPYNDFHGTALNPASPLHISGGSSSGTAAAIAANFVTCGLGTDTLGSCRYPANACGVAGMRPSRGRYPLDGIIPLELSNDTAGPMGSCV